MWTKLIERVSGLNIYKWGAILGGLIAWTVIVYMFAGHRVEMKQKEAEVAEVKERVVVITRYVKDRVPVVTEREVKSKTELATIARLKKELADAQSKRPDLPECAVSDAERTAFNGLLEDKR